MGYLLLAIEIVAVSLLFVALAVALVSRRGRWVRLVGTAAAVALMLAVYALAMLFDYAVEFAAGIVKTGLFGPLVAMTLLFLAGAAIIVRLGLRAEPALDDEPRPGPTPAARAWPPGRLAVALGVAFALGLMTLANLDQAARESLASLRSEAYALAMSVAPARVPDHENASIYYQQATDALERESLRDEKSASPWHSLWIDAVAALEPENDTNFDFNTPEMRAFIEAHRGEIELLRAGAALPGYYYDRDYGQIDVSTLLPDVQGLREGARLLAIHARWSAANDDVKSSLDDISAIAALARHVASGPFAVTLLVAESFDSSAFATLQAVLRSHDPTAEELAVARVNHLYSYRRQMNRILRGDEAIMLNTMVQIDSQLGLRAAIELSIDDPGTLMRVIDSKTVSLLGLDPFYRVFILQPGLAAYRDAMQQACYAASMSYSRFQADSEHLRPEMIERSLFAHTVASMMSVVESGFRADARNLLAYTALAMYRYRAEHGRFPDALTELSPGVIPLVPVDPYDDQPLRLEKNDRGWILYSVGPDTTDNHGQPFDWNTKNGDLTFEGGGLKEER
jgi:hypothetical protein